MAITAAQVKELRERTGSGMMECKKALVETNGDIEAAIEAMRKSGLAKADKKAGRTAAEGVIVIKASDDNNTAIMIEVNSETDFVAKGDDFINFVDVLSQSALDAQPADLEALVNMPLQSGGESVNEARQALIAKIGENINVRRYAAASTDDGVIGTYTHGGRIGVVVQMKGGSEELAKDIAMHVAASKPVCVDDSGVPAETIEKEKEILTAQALESGKPAEIVEKMIGGRIKKYLSEITLLGQQFVKNPDQTVAQLLTDAGAEVVSFQRFEVGEGIEKQEDNFVSEVMAQVQGG
jgi:elongation factor Ts